MYRQKRKNCHGFVYIWRDRKHKRYYIGCHWGTETDGYVCSSRWMRNSYKRRPQDFKRRILETNIPDRSLLLEREFAWLQLIQDHELKTKYYNLQKNHFSHWSQNPKTRKQIAEKLSKERKGKHYSPATEIKPGERRSPKTEFKKGQQAHNANRTLEERYGEERAAEIRMKSSISHKGQRNSPATEFKPGQNTGASNVNAKRINTPHGIFQTIKQASQQLRMSAPAIRSRLKADKHTDWVYN